MGPLSVEILIVSTQTVGRVHQIEAKWNKLFLGNGRDETEREDQMSKINVRKWFVLGGEKQVGKKGSTNTYQEAAQLREKRES